MFNARTTADKVVPAQRTLISTSDNIPVSYTHLDVYKRQAQEKQNK